MTRQRRQSKANEHSAGVALAPPDTEPTDLSESIPPYDPVAVGRVAKHVEITSVELLGAYFERNDDGPLPMDLPSDLTPDIGYGGFEASVSDDGATLGCVLNFAAVFDDDEERQDPYQLLARFRLVYAISADESLDPADIDVFLHWNCLFNAWPYWREYVSSTVNRAQLPRFVVPVMGVPRQSQNEVADPS